ncbi:MAG: hypothetical protein ACREQ8_07020 [Woeseiaceae bacterium]
MVARNTHESDVHDLSLSVIHALALVDVKALSYMQLRRLFAALTHALEDVDKETALRAERANSGDTVSVPAVKLPDK